VRSVQALVDINILLDTLLLRRPHEPAATRLLSEIERGRASGYLCAASVDTLYSLLRRTLDTGKASELTRVVRRLLGIAPVDADVIDAALALGWRDLEDAIIHESARRAGLSMIVTRDARDFRNGSLVVADAGEALAMLAYARR